jgi:hypothetical protein
MKNSNRNDSFSFDDKLDALLRRRAVTPSDDFAAKTIARIRSAPEVGDGMIDDLLAEKPVRTSPDFTSRTMRAALRESVLLAFARPVLAAAASVAVCLVGIRAFQSFENSATDTSLANVAAQVPAEEDEIVTLARALGDAAPLLDSRAGEALALLAGSKE